MSAQPCREGERLTVRAATQEAACRVERIERRVDSSTLAVLEERAPAVRKSGSDPPDQGSARMWAEGLGSGGLTRFSAAVRETEIGRVVFSAERPLVLEPFHGVPELGRLVIVRDEDVAGGALVSSAADLAVEGTEGA